MPYTDKFLRDVIFTVLVGKLSSTINLNFYNAHGTRVDK